jgi:putative oxidoreductase
MTRSKRWFPIVVRLVLGLVFVGSGVAGLLGAKPPAPEGSAAAAFLQALAATGYMLPLLKLTEFAAGLLILSGRFTALGLVLLAPVLVNIAGFHLFLAPAALPMVALFISAAIYLARVHREAFAPLFRVRPPARGPLATLITTPNV